MSKKPSIQPIWTWTIAGLLIVVAVLAIRHFCVGSYRISTDAMEETIHKGDFVLVDKLPSNKNPMLNRPILFRSPLTQDVGKRTLFISRVAGMPGDSIALTADYSVVVPKKNRTYRLDPVTLSICKEAILQETDGKAVIRDDKLFIDGRETHFFFFSRDYYWVLSDNEEEGIDSRHLGFIPADCVIGSIWFCWYSADKQHRFKRIY